MSKFKIGDIVCVAANPYRESYVKRLLECEGIIIGPSESYDWLVDIDNHAKDNPMALREEELELVYAAEPLPAKVRTFTVYRRGDISETHTPDQMNNPDDPQFFGCIFPSGKVVVNWNTAIKSVSVFDSYEDLLKIHGHVDDLPYQTEIVWDD